MKRVTAASLFLSFALALGDLAAAQTEADECARTEIEKVEGPGVWQPGPGGNQIPIWPEGLAIALPDTGGNDEWVGNGSPLVAGRTWNWATYISRPTMTIYAPQGANSGAAVLVLPGGGYAAVAMDLEGVEICDWLVAQGITCIVLKYRVPQIWRRGADGRRQPPEVSLPLQDAQRAISLLRRDAATYNIDPNRIGVIGFSAGGHLAALLSNAEGRTYDRVDDADEQLSRPNFAILAYPGRLWDVRSSPELLRLAPWIQVRAEAPPTLLIHAMNDPVDEVQHSMAYGLALHQLGVPVDMRFFAGGCHAFGLRPTSDPITTQWPGLTIDWLRNIDVLQ